MDIEKSLRLGLQANWQQFTLLVVVNAFVGSIVGLERTLIPLLGEAEFGLASKSLVLSFLVSFGIVKALANLSAGWLGDRWGRKQVLVAGWLFGLPLPVLIILAPTWNWVVFANVLLGINQGLCWSTTVIMKIDLVGPKRRGLAMGLNEFAGYLAVSISALATGFLAASHGLRPVPFYPGMIFAGLGLLLSVFFVQESRQHAAYESSLIADNAGKNKGGSSSLSFSQVFSLTSWRNRSLFAASQAGMINNLNDGMVWGLVPIFLASAGLSVERIGLVAAVYPAVWGMGQLLTGALSDRWGRKWLIVAGMLIQAVGIELFIAWEDFWVWILAAAILGVGTALVYPTLLAAVSDIAHPAWRGTSVGVYRLWRDLGFAVGGITAGLVADLFGPAVAIGFVGGLTMLSGTLVAGVMLETLTPSRPKSLT